MTMNMTFKGNRRRPFRIAVTILAVLILMSTAAVGKARAAMATTAPTVHVSGGWVHGSSEAQVYKFLGVPYAAPPKGDLRWRPPQPASKWLGIRDATQYAPSCVQAQLNNPFFPPGAMSEDCLYLNVFTPTVHPAFGHPLPVIVWIHGGGLVQDASRNYDGSKLAAAGAVVVTVNYRLSALGFLAHPALASHGAAGNYGLMDQQAALRWVRHNIAGFGGNPFNVAIAGQSAGGLSVLAHLVSRGSRGLFQRAIVQSGAFALTQQSLSAAEAVGTTVASNVGCGNQAAQCLRNASATDLVNAFPSGIPGVVDGSVLTESIRTALTHGRYAHVPILNGVMHDEERLFVHLLGLAVSNGAFTIVPIRPVNDANYQSNIAFILGVSSSRAAAIAAEYPPDTEGDAEATLSTVVSDANFVCPALAVDKWTSPWGRTFAYQFNDDTAPINIAPPHALPAVSTHGSELPYLFDQLNAPFPASLNADQQALAASMRAAWVRFAASGNPSTATVNWPSFGTGRVMSLESPQIQVQTDSAATHHCQFWATG